MSAPLLAAGAVGLLLLSRRGSQGATPRPLDSHGGALAQRDVERLIAGTIDAYRYNVSPTLAVSIAFQESSWRPGVIGDDGASIGLMQTKLSTAAWLYEDMGYTDLARPTADNLKDPNVSAYFGLAFLHWLSRYKGVARDATWMARAYNAGAEGAILGRAQSYAGKIDQHHRRLYGRGL